VWDVETAQTRSACPEVPFALCLVSQRPGLPAEAVVEQVDPLERLASSGRVDAQRPRNAFSKLARLVPVILERNHRLMPARPVGQPRGAITAPERQNFAADVIAVEGVEVGGSPREPIRFNSRVIVCRRDD